MDTIQTLLRIPALLVLLDVQSAQEEAILNVPAAPLAIISNPLLLQPLVWVLVQVDTTQTARITSA